MQVNLELENPLTKKIEESIRRIKEHVPEDGRPLKVGFSGGKDSICCKELCNMAGVKYEAHYSFTTIDPPELVKFIKTYHPDVIIDKPIYKGEQTSFYKLIEMKGLPTRLVRWCCDYLKEVNGNKGDTMVLGVRWEESAKRANREIYSDWKGKHILNPIIDWTMEDVWNFIHSRNLPYPDLYDQGHRRLGCILCPLACKKARVRDYEEYPNHVKAIENAVGKFIERKPNTSLMKWGSTPHEIVYYWVHMTPIESAKGQCMQQFSEQEDKQ